MKLDSVGHVYHEGNSELDVTGYSYINTGLSWLSGNSLV